MKELETTMVKEDIKLSNKVKRVNKRVDDVTKLWTDKLSTNRVEISCEIKAANENNCVKLAQLNKQIADGMTGILLPRRTFDTTTNVSNPTIP